METRVVVLLGVDAIAMTSSQAIEYNLSPHFRDHQTYLIALLAHEGHSMQHVQQQILP